MNVKLQQTQAANFRWRRLYLMRYVCWTDGPVFIHASAYAQENDVDAQSLLWFHNAFELIR